MVWFLVLSFPGLGVRVPVSCAGFRAWAGLRVRDQNSTAELDNVPLLASFPCSSDGLVLCPASVILASTCFMRCEHAGLLLLVPAT